MDGDFTRRRFLKAAGAAALAGAALPAWAQERQRITLAFVGVAHIHTQEYIDLVKKRPDVRVKYIWDHDEKRAARRGDELKVPTVANPNTIWSDPEVNAVVILSETNRHRELVLAAAAAGKNLFVEKPLGITGHGSLEMARAIEKAGVIFTTGYFFRTDPKNLFLKNEIAAGHFGTITRAQASLCHNGSLAGWFDHEWRWMADPKIAGVGAFGDLGTHQLDILMWLLGDIESVSAEIHPVTRRYGDCDETGVSLIRFKNGVIGTLSAGWVDIEDPVRLLISGTEAHAVIFRDQLYYRSLKRPGSDASKPWTELPPAAKPPMDQFLDAVAGAKNQPLVSPRDAASRVGVMEAMYEASRHHKWVELA